MSKRYFCLQSILFLIISFISLIFPHRSILATGNLSGISISLSSYSLGATNVEATVTLTTGSTLSVGQFIEVQLPYFLSYNSDISEFTFVSASPSVDGFGIVAKGNNPNTNSIIQNGFFAKTSGATIPVDTTITFKISGLSNTNQNMASAALIKTITQPGGITIDGDANNSMNSYYYQSYIYNGSLGFKGTITNNSSNPVSMAYVNIVPAAMSGGAMPMGSQTDSGGKYMITANNLSIGSTYFLEVFSPMNGGGNLLAPDRYTTAYSGSVETKNFQFTVGTKTITGTVIYTGTTTPVTNAGINAFKTNGSGFSQTTTNDSGVYTLTVGGGDWGVMPQATQGVSDWSYGKPPTDVKFSSTTAPETYTTNFEVYQATATITGRLLKPNGSPVTQSDGLGIGIFSQEGKGGGTQINNNNGTFSITVPAGTYNVNVWAPPSSSYGTPNVSPVTVADNQTKSVGDITLVTKDSIITGTVRTTLGVGISGVRINAFVRDGGGFSEATTDANGSFSLSVTAGKWTVMPFFSYDSAYALNNPPQEVSVSASSPANVNFEVQTASATISGVIQDGDGNPVSIYGYAMAEVGGQMFGPGGLGGPIERGNFSFKVPAGTYTVNAGLAPGSGYTPGSGTSVTITDGETKSIVVTVTTNNSTITGSIIDAAGNPISSSGLFVFAVSRGGGHEIFQQGTVSGSTYTVSVASGEWTLGYFVDPSSGYMSSPPDPTDKLTVTNGGTTTKDITLQTANATITGKVTKPDGSNAVGVFVSVDNRETEGKEFFNGAPTDTNGNYTIRITSGTYKVRVNVPPGQGLLSPAEQNITVAANSSQTADFILRTSDATINGQVTLDGTGVPAFVYAWADDGGFAQYMSDSTGNYSLSVTRGTTWHVGARYENGTTPYESSETSVSLTSSSSTANLTLSSVSYNLPQSISTTFDATQPKIIELSDGTEINIPASALATSGNVTLNISPKASLPSKKGDKPLWYGYEFTASDSNGQAITQFNSTITITFPYSESMLTTKGITAGDLVPSYWDDTSGTWKKVNNVTVNTTNKTITITTDHFTDYALTANIAASSSSSSSPSSNNASTNASNPACNNQAPSNAPYLFEIRRTRDQAKIFFAPARNPVTYYYIAYGSKSNPQEHGVSFDQGSSSGVLSFTINKLKNTDYYFQIRAGNGCMPGPWSNTMLAKPSRTSYYTAASKVVSTKISPAIKTSKTKIKSTIEKSTTEKTIITPTAIITQAPKATPVEPIKPSVEAPKKKSFWDTLKQFFSR